MIRYSLFDRLKSERALICQKLTAEKQFDFINNAHSHFKVDMDPRRDRQLIYKLTRKFYIFLARRSIICIISFFKKGSNDISFLRGNNKKFRFGSKSDCIVRVQRYQIALMTEMMMVRGAQIVACMCNDQWCTYRASLSVMCVYYPRVSYVHIVADLLTILKKALMKRIISIRPLARRKNI